jgi:hypothetical protein
VGLRSRHNSSTLAENKTEKIWKHHAEQKSNFIHTIKFGPRELLRKKMLIVCNLPIFERLTISTTMAPCRKCSTKIEDVPIQTKIRKIGFLLEW